MTMGYIFPDGVASCQIRTLHELYNTYIGYKKDGYFVEIGAFDGFNWSNTMPLITAGWSGIMVEPDPTNFKNLSARHGSNPRLQLVKAAVCNISAVIDGKVKLYLGGSTSTVEPHTVDIYRSIPSLAIGGLSHDHFVMVDACTMDELLFTKHCPARYDVLVVDVEGGEEDVLLDYTIDEHRPKMAIIEAHEHSPYSPLRAKSIYINAFFKKNGYKKVYSDQINSIFVNDRDDNG